jgi:hypothetical protein
MIGPTMWGPDGMAHNQFTFCGTPWPSSCALLQPSSVSSQSRSRTTRFGAPVVPPLS